MEEAVHEGGEAKHEATYWGCGWRGVRGCQRRTKRLVKLSVRALGSLGKNDGSSSGGSFTSVLSYLSSDILKDGHIYENSSKML